MNLRKHFDISRWVEFVRGTAEADARTMMEQHLASGCQRCERIVRVLRVFAEHAAAEAGYEPPGHVIRRAEAIFAPQRPEGSMLARLIYDSFREPLPAGLRAEDRVARHALYEAGNVCLDLRLEHEPTSDTITLIGQIADRVRPDANTTTLPVLLMTGKGVVASAICNRLGEFEMEYKPARDLRLHVPLRGSGGRIEVQMDELGAPPRSTRAARTTGPRRSRVRKRSQQ